MALLVNLDLAIDGLDLKALVSGPVAQLGSVQTAVTALVSGPPELTALLSALASPPVPPSAGGLGDLGGGFDGLLGAVPSDLVALFEPVLAPLRGLTELSITVSATGSVTAAFDLFRRVGELVTERFSRGAKTFPGLFSSDSGLDLDGAHEAFVAFEKALDDFGAKLDAAKLLELVTRAAGPWLKAEAKLPPIPVLAEVLESLGTIARWERMSPAELTSSLRATLENAAILIATPRTQVAGPVLAAAQLAASAPAVLATANDQLSRIYPRLAASVRAGAQPSQADLTLVETQLDALEALGRALDLEDGALSGFRNLPYHLERQLVRVVRAIHGGYEGDTVRTLVDGLVGQIPVADPAPLANVVAAVEAFDITALTGPLAELRDAVETARSGIEAAFAAVETAVRTAVAPLRDGLVTLTSVVHLDDLRSGLESAPAAITAFVDSQVKPALETLRSLTETAVDGVGAAVAAFNPDTIRAEVEAAMRSIAEIVTAPEVMGPLREVTQALGQAAEVVRGFDLTPAADQSIQIMAGIEGTLSKIDPAVIPEDAKPVLRQAVDAVTGLDVKAEVATPLLSVAQTALSEGPVTLLREVEGTLLALKARLDAFRPSSLVGDSLDAPFRDLEATLKGFSPSQLFEPVEAALAGLREKLHVVDPSAVLAPLEAAYSALETALAALEPEALLAPVRRMLQTAVDHVMAQSGLDQAFEGLASVLDEVKAGVALLDRVRSSLDRLAGKLSDPADADVALAGFVDHAVSRLGAVELAALAPAFAACADAAASTSRDRLASDLARVLRAASVETPPALVPAPAQLAALADAFPVALLGVAPKSPERERLLRSLVRLRAVERTLEAAVDPWHEASVDLGRLAETVYARLSDYHRLSRLEGDDVFAGFRTVPATIAELQAAVRTALHDGLALPVALVFGVFRALAPHAAGFTRGLSGLLRAIHGKFDAVLGDSGLSGIVAGTSAVIDRLRTVDFTPLTGPLAALHDDLVDALRALDPRPLRAVLEAVRAALEDLLRVASLLDPAKVAQLDRDYATAVAAFSRLSPRALLVDAIDPVYEKLLADVLPAFDLVTELRVFFESAATSLTAEIDVELGRVEEAFDRMLRAIPLGPGGPGGGSVGGSVSVSGSLSLS